MKRNHKRLISANFLGFNIANDDGHRWINFCSDNSNEAKELKELAEKENVWFSTNDKYWVRQQDNLEFMMELESESIDLIYCDILYGTGRSFGDFQDLKSNKNTIDKFYKPRLIEMFRLLKKQVQYIYNAIIE